MRACKRAQICMCVSVSVCVCVCVYVYACVRACVRVQAASERAKKAGERIKESGASNLSLHHLASVIAQVHCACLSLQ